MVNWNADILADLERLYRQGLSCGEIGKQLGCSRNAVIGKLARSGLRAQAYDDGGRARPKRRPPSNPRIKPIRNEKSPYRPVQPAGAPPVVLPQSPEQPPMMATLSLLELSANTCRWPIGDPREAGFFYCGNETPGTGPYCSHHAELARVPRNRDRAETPTGGYRYGSKS